MYLFIYSYGGFKIGFMSPITEWAPELQMTQHITVSKNALVFTHM